MSTIKVRLKRSPIGKTQKQKDTVRTLGLTKIGQIVEKEDTPRIRGILNSIPHLVEIVE